MNKRLKYCCELIPLQGKGFADIGTDHAQVPIWLAENGYSGYIYASDIAKDPLSRAKAAASNAGVSENIHFEQCDGLDSCPAEMVDCILIAGMGGDNICRILDRCEWIFQGDHLFIVQPMTHPEVLRYWLIHNEFKIVREAVITEGERIYQIFAAEVGKTRAYLDSEYFTGAADVLHEGEPRSLLLSMLQKQFESLFSDLPMSRVNEESSTRFLYSVYEELNTKPA